jgi:type IV pilus assembly protein PilC
MGFRDAWEDLLDELEDRRKDLAAALGRRRKRLGSREEANFLRQLSLMIESGIPFTEALEVLRNTMQDGSAELARLLGDALYRGYPLSHAFWSCKAYLSEVAPPLVEAGEASGGLVRTLHIAADWAETSANLRARLKAAMTYPFFVLLVNGGLAAAMLAYVFPTFVPLFKGEALPLLTRFFLALSWLATSKLFWVVAIIVLAELFLFFSQPEHQQKLYRLGVALPVLNALLRSAARTRFCAVLAVTTRTGLPLMQALSLAAQASGDPVFADLDPALQAEVRDGAPLPDHFLAHTDVYGLVLSHGMALCHSTGNTDLVCSHLTHLFQAETEVRIQQFQAVLEPLMIALVSLTTGTLLLSIYLPLGRFLQSLLA